MHFHHRHSSPQSAPHTDGKLIRWADSYDWLVRLLTLGREKAFRNATIRHARIAQGDIVLDVGCGTGTLALMANAAAGSSGQVYGIDASAEMIVAAGKKAAAQRSAVDFRAATIEALPFFDGMFDVILSSLMFHHLPTELKRRGLDEMFRVLKPGGHMLIVDVTRPKTLAQHLSPISLIHHRLTNDIDELALLAKEVGYGHIETGTFGHNPIAFVRGYRPS